MCLGNASIGDPLTSRFLRYFRSWNPSSSTRWMPHPERLRNTRLGKIVSVVTFSSGKAMFDRSRNWRREKRTSGSWAEANRAARGFPARDNTCNLLMLTSWSASIDFSRFLLKSSFRRLGKSTGARSCNPQSARFKKISMVLLLRSSGVMALPWASRKRRSWKSSAGNVWTQKKASP